MEHEVDKVLQVGDQHNLPHWKVYYGTDIKRQQIYCSSESIEAPETSITWDSSRVTLQTYLNLAPANVYTIHFKKNLTDKSPSDIRQMVFKITDNAAAGIGGLVQPVQQQSFSPQFMMQYMQAEIGKATANITLNAKIEEYERKLERQKEDYERRLKEQGKKKDSAFDFQGLTGLIKEGKQAYIDMQIANNMQKPPAKAIVIAGKDSPAVPADANTNKVTAEEDEKYMLSDELKLVDGETISELVDIFGNAEETVIVLFCLKEFLKVPENKAQYDLILKPRLEEYRQKLVERGIIENS